MTETVKKAQEPAPLMPKDLGLEKQTFHCECWTSEHHFHVTYDRVEDEVQVEVMLNHYLPWWKRILEAFKYVFKMGRLGYADVLLKPEDRVKLAEILLRKKEEPMVDGVRISADAKLRLQELAGIKPQKKERKKNVGNKA